MSKQQVDQQATLVATLEAEANDAQVRRDDAADRYDLAHHRYRQPNRWIWKNHGNALLIAGMLSLGGVGIALGQGNPTWGVLGTGAAVAVGMVSKAMDDDRQTWEKEDRLIAARERLDRAEQALNAAVSHYREAEETRWLMLALDISQHEFLQFRDWMADPRRSMKDAILESVDLVSSQLLQRSSEVDPLPGLTQERQRRALKHQLFSPEFQLAKEEFMAAMAAKHSLRRQQEKTDADRQAMLQIATTSIGTATAAGVAAGASVASLITTAASAWDQSRGLANTMATIGGAATVVGVGILTAGTIANLMFQGEKERQQREEQRFQAAFTITQSVHSAIVHLCSLPDPGDRQAQASQVLATLTAFRQRELKTQDQELKTFVDLLYSQLTRYVNLR